jgi:glucosamine--fructose-6-phosphate aminotransferase (isomerizing)
MVLRTGLGDAGGIGLPALPADHPDTDAVCLIQSFYGFLVRLAERRGTDLQAPRHLQKVTRTK